VLETMDAVDYSMMVAIRNPADGKGAVRLGVIDYLQPYDISKKLESKFKMMLHAGQLPTVIKPALYRKRFCEFIASAFEPDPEAVLAKPVHLDLCGKVGRGDDADDGDEADDGGNTRRAADHGKVMAEKKVKEEAAAVKRAAGEKAAEKALFVAVAEKAAAAARRAARARAAAARTVEVTEAAAETDEALKAVNEIKAAQKALMKEVKALGKAAVQKASVEKAAEELAAAERKEAADKQASERDAAEIVAAEKAAAAQRNAEGKVLARQASVNMREELMRVVAEKAAVEKATALKEALMEDTDATARRAAQRKAERLLKRASCQERPMESEANEKEKTATENLTPEKVGREEQATGDNAAEILPEKHKPGKISSGDIDVSRGSFASCTSAEQGEMPAGAECNLM